MSNVENRLSAHGLSVPDAPRPLGNFAPYLLDGANLYISGQIAIDANGAVLRGKLGQDMDIAAGIDAARWCGVGVLARAKSAVGDLDRIAKLIKLGVFVNALPDFSDHPKVANGASDLMAQAFGHEVAEHVRFAVGCPSLPSNAAVEVEAVFRVRA